MRLICSLSTLELVTAGVFAAYFEALGIAGNGFTPVLSNAFAGVELAISQWPDQILDQTSRGMVMATFSSFVHYM
jgi:hypothetical protein